MAMMTWVRAVTVEQLAALRKDHELIRSIEGETSHFTHAEASINYFLTGNAYPGVDDGPLCHLFGVESVKMPTFETGYFTIVPVESVQTNARLLAEVDLDAVAQKIRDADVQELIDEEKLYELEVIAADEIEEFISSDISRLTDFYVQASDAGLAVVSYTS